MNQEYKAIYEEFLAQDEETASQEIRDSYSEMNNEFERYLCAIQEDMFRKAFEFGYVKGVEAAEKRKTA